VTRRRDDLTYAGVVGATETETLPAGYRHIRRRVALGEGSDSGRVWFDIRAFSRPATWVGRAGGPVAALLQTRITDRYVAAARSLGRPDAARSHG
jgi:uncharacterized protein (UPF0548 family)